MKSAYICCIVLLLGIGSAKGDSPKLDAPFPSAEEAKILNGRQAVLIVGGKGDWKCQLVKKDDWYSAAHLTAPDGKFVMLSNGGMEGDASFLLMRGCPVVVFEKPNAWKGMGFSDKNDDKMEMVVDGSNAGEEYFFSPKEWGNRVRLDFPK